MRKDDASASKDNVSDSNDVRPSFLCSRDFDILARTHSKIEGTNGKLRGCSLCFSMLQLRDLGLLSAVFLLDLGF